MSKTSNGKAKRQLRVQRPCSEPPPELIIFVRNQIAHKIGRHTFSREWSEGQVRDAAKMIADYAAQNEKGQPPCE